MRATVPSSTGDDARADAGIGLIEIVVSMFLIALLAMAFLPLLITSLKATTSNTTAAVATQLVSEQLEQLRIVDTKRSAVEAFLTVVPPAVTDDRGVVLLTARQLVGVYPTTYPGTVKVRIVVTQGGATVSQATTLVLVVAP